MDSSLLIYGENQKDPLTDTSDLKHRRSSSKWNDDISQVGNAITESAQVGEHVIVFPVVCSCSGGLERFIINM